MFLSICFDKILSFACSWKHPCVFHLILSLKHGYEDIPYMFPSPYHTIRLHVFRPANLLYTLFSARASSELDIHINLHQQPPGKYVNTHTHRSIISNVIDPHLCTHTSTGFTLQLIILK